MSQLKDFITTVEIFKNCSEESLNYFYSVLELVEYKSGEVIFEEDTVGEDIYIIYSGEVEIIKNYKKSNKKLLSILLEKEIFGEMSLFYSSERTATAVAKTDCKIIKIKSEYFRNIFRTYPEDGLKIVQRLLFNMGTRLEQTSKELASIYAISNFMIETVKTLQVKVFLTFVCTELSVAIGIKTTIGIYIYNIFTEEFELVNVEGKSAGTFQQSYSKNDKSIEFIWESSVTGVIDIKERPNTLFSIMRYLNEVIGFILIVSEDEKFSQREKDLVNSVTNLLSVAIVTLKNLQEEQQKNIFQQRKITYTL